MLFKSKLQVPEQDLPVTSLSPVHTGICGHITHQRTGWHKPKRKRKRRKGGVEEEDEGEGGGVDIQRS